VATKHPRIDIAITLRVTETWRQQLREHVTERETTIQEFAAAAIRERMGDAVHPEKGEIDET